MKVEMSFRAVRESSRYMRKKAGRQLLCPVIVSACMLAVSGCERQNTFDPSAHRYICILPPEEEYYWGDLKDGIREADREFGCYSKIETYERFDLELQNELLEQTKTFHTDGIITVGQPSNETVTETLRQITRSGVPVVLVDTDSDQDSRTAYVGSDNRKAGELAASAILESMEEPVHALIIVSEMDNANQRERAEGFQETMESSGRGEIIRVLESRGDTSALLEMLEELFRQEPESDMVTEAGAEASVPNAVFCAEASTTQRTGLFIKNQGISGTVKAVGFDLVGQTQELVNEGALYGTIVQQAEQIGYQASHMLEQICAKEEITSCLYTQATFLSAGDISSEPEKKVNAAGQSEEAR